MSERRRTKTRVRSVSRGACLVVVAVGACCGTVSEAFVPRPSTLHPINTTNNFIAQSRTTNTDSRAMIAKSVAAAMAARKGFSRSSAEPSPRASLSKGFGETPVAGAGGGGLEAWEKEYKAYIKRTGQYLCSMSWEGHQEMGRGAIFANYDDARVGDQLNDADNFGGIPSMYVPLMEFESMRSAGKPGEEDNLEQILRRVKSYCPEEEFVVVFQAKGIMGADVVKPSISPPEMAKYVTRSDGESRGATPRHSSSPVGQAEGEGGVIDV